MPEEESLRKPTCTPGRSLPGQEKHSVHKSLAPERMHLVDLPEGQGCWELCSCPLKLTSFDVHFTGRLQQGLGSFWLPGNCSLFKKLKKVSVQFGSKPNFVYIYIYIFKPLHFQGTGNTAFQPALLDSFIGLCHNKSEVRRNRKALLSNNRGWGSGKGGLNQRQACWVTVLPAEHKIHVPEAWSKSRGYKALHLTAPQSRTNQGASLESEVLCPEQSLVSSDGRTLDYFSGISEQMLLASYGCLPTYGALLCHQTLPKIQSSFWQQRTVFIYHENWSGLGSQFCKLFISCQ